MKQEQFGVISFSRRKIHRRYLSFVVIQFLAISFLSGYIVGGKNDYSKFKKDVTKDLTFLKEQTEENDKILNKFKEVKSVKLTGYSNDPRSINLPGEPDGFTATMTRARRGVCAADWNVFPVGTRIYVPNYGDCIVEDRGGAVRGKHLDLFFDSEEQANNWGVRYGRVVVKGKVRV